MHRKETCACKSNAAGIKHIRGPCASHVCIEIPCRDLGSEPSSLERLNRGISVLHYPSKPEYAHADLAGAPAGAKCEM